MAVYVRTKYRGQESWYRLLRSYCGVPTPVQMLPVPEGSTTILENVRGGQLEFTFEHKVIESVETDDFADLWWTGTILCDPNASQGWLTASGQFWGQDRDLMTEAAKYALRGLVVEALGSDADSRYGGSSGQHVDQLLDTGAVYVRGRNRSHPCYDHDPDIPLTDAQTAWLVANGFKLHESAYPDYAKEGF